jgi:hypothetical protein
VTQHGGVVAETRRSPDGAGAAVMVVGLLSIAQAVAMLAAEAHEEVRAGLPAGFASGLGSGEDLAVGEWVGRWEEDSRRLGIERLARLLSSAGIKGDVETAADGLWTDCGY